MRYINLNDLKLPKGWKKKANDLNKKLRAAKTQNERSDLMDKNPIWNELVVPLSRLSNHKCWYSEARDVMSDRDVDHFRPKNKALNEDKKARDGYWFLAYDEENYRFSSIYSNRLRDDKYDETKGVGGKGCYFPLFPGSPIATTKNKLRDEDIMLLDPTDEDDPGLLTFDKDGKAIPNTNIVKEKKRVDVSIKFYHLDHTPLEEVRMEVWNKCQRFIDQLSKLEADPDPSITDKANIKFLKKEIKAMLDKREEFSSVAYACVEANKMTRKLALM